MKKYLSLSVLVTILLGWWGCQSQNELIHISPPPSVVQSPKPTTKTILDGPLRSLLRHKKSLYSNTLIQDKRGQYRVLLKLKPGHPFPTMKGLTRYAHVGQIYSASATASALRQLSTDNNILRIEAAPRLKVRSGVASSSIIAHTSSFQSNSANDPLTYKLTVPSAGKVTIKVFGEVSEQGGNLQEVWIPVLTLCEDIDCNKTIDTDYASFGQQDPNDPHPTPESHASLTHTFTQAGSVYININPFDNSEGKFSLLIYSNELDLTKSQLTDGDLNDKHRHIGLGAGPLSKKENIDGSGAIIGVIDTGIDWCHASFVRAGNKSPVLFLWDTDLTPKAGDTSPDESIVGTKDYGVLYSKTQIEAAIPNCDTTKVRSQDTSGHGTHVAGIAYGIAPGADLIIVKGLSDVLSAFKFIVAKAKELKRPVAINMSLGGHDTSHDGSSLTEKAILNAIGPGVNVFVAASNEGSIAIHAQSTLANNESKTLQYELPSDQNRLEINIFTDANDTFEVKFKIRGKEIAMDWTKDGKVSEADYELEWVAGENHSPNNAVKRTNVIVAFNNALTKEETFEFALKKTGGTGSGVFDAYDVTEKGVFLNHVPKHADGSVKGTMASPGTSKGAIAVGAYNVRNIFDIENGNYYLDSTTFLIPGDMAPFSSRGPTRDGRPGVTIVTPGNYIESVMTGYITDCKKDPKLQGCADLISRLTKQGTYIAEGTSMATPMGTGSAALLLQKDPTLYVRPLLQSTAQTPNWDNQKLASIWGKGLVRLPGAFAKWSAGDVPKVTLSATGGQTKGAAPFEVELKINNTNATPLGEVLWNTDGVPGNEHTTTTDTIKFTLAKKGTYTISATYVAESGRTATASLQLEVTGATTETNTETANEPTVNDAADPDDDPQQDTQANDDPQTDDEPQVDDPPQKEVDPATDKTPQDEAKKGGCGCSSSPQEQLPTNALWLLIMLLFIPRRKNTNQSTSPTGHWLSVAGGCLLLMWSVIYLQGCPSTSSSTKTTQKGSATSKPAMSVQKTTLKLTPTTPSVKKGKSLIVKMQHVDGKPYEYQFKGGSSACVLPIYKLSLTDQKGITYTSHNSGKGRRCPRQKVSPRLIKLTNGESIPLTIRTDSYWYIPGKRMRDKAKRVSLQPGVYTLTVKGGGVKLVHKSITIKPSK